MEDIASTMAQTRAIILDESSEAPRNLKYWAEWVEKTIAQMMGTHDTCEAKLHNPTTMSCEAKLHNPRETQ